MKIKSHHKKILFSLIFLCCLFLVYLFLFWLVSKEANKFHEIKKNLDQIGEKSENLANVKRSVDNVSVERELVAGHFFDSTEDIVSLIESFESLKNRVGVSLEVKKIDEDKDPILIEYVVLGSENNVREFINQTEKLPFVFRFENIVFKKFQEGEGGVDRWTADVSLSVLSFIK